MFWKLSLPDQLFKLKLRGFVLANKEKSQKVRIINCALVIKFHVEFHSLKIVFKRFIPAKRWRIVDNITPAIAK